MKVTNIYHQGKFLSENDLMPPEECCLFCRSKNKKVVAVIQKQPDVDLFECLECHAVSASRMPFKEVLDKYYSYYYDKNSSKVTMGNITKFAKHIYYGFPNNFEGKESFSILDFGGGNGSISYALAKDYLLKTCKNISISVVDYSETMRSEVPEISLKHYSSLSQIDVEKFDLVLASAIIEHFPYPEEELTKLFSLLKENGLFYARTPYVLPLLRLLKRFGIEMDFTYPGHLHDLGQEFWNNITNKLYPDENLKIIRSRPSIVETSFNQDFIKTLLAYIFKFPWYLFRRFYGYVGGWEIFIIKSSIKK